MNLKLPKLYFIISTALILTGIATMTVGAIRVQDDRDKHMTSKIEYFEDISNLDICLSQGDLYLQKNTENNTACTVEFVNMLESVELYSENGILYVKDDRSMNFQFFSIGFLNPTPSEIRVTLPEQEYQQVMLKLNTGDCHISDLQCEILNLDSDIGNCEINQTKVQNECIIDSGTGSVRIQNIHAGKTSFLCDIGDFNLENCEMQSLELATGTGSLKLNTVTVQENFSIESSVGDIVAEELTCSGNMNIEQGTGECMIQGADFSGTVTASTDIGDISFYDIIVKNNLTLDSDTGDVLLHVIGDSDNYAVDCSACVGDVYLNHVKVKQLDLNQEADYQIVIKNDIGDVELSFEDVI